VEICCSFLIAHSYRVNDCRRWVVYSIQPGKFGCFHEMLHPTPSEMIAFSMDYNDLKE